jgi:hypothetical protein
MMIVRSKGQLGNQMFIYSAAWKARHRNERFLLLGFDELAASFRGLIGKRLDIPNYSRQKKKVEIVLKALRGLASFRLIGIIRVDESGGQFVRRNGILPLALFDAGFCQDERLCDLEPLLSLRSEKLTTEAERIKSLCPELFDKQGEVCFVHVRRGDYLRWPSAAAAAALPADFYLKQISTIYERNPEARFLVFSDDIGFCQEIFCRVPGVRVVEADSVTSWLAISLCDSGVLSASTFSWWAARIASHESAGGLFLAPAFWTFWAERVWPEISPRHSSFISWVEV